MLAGHRRVVEDLGPTPFLIIGLKDLGARISLESYHLRVEAHLGGIYVQVNATWTEWWTDGLTDEHTIFKIYFIAI